MSDDMEWMTIVVADANGQPWTSVRFLAPVGSLTGLITTWTTDFGGQVTLAPTDAVTPWGQPRPNEGPEFDLEVYRAQRVARSGSGLPLADTSHHTPEYLAELEAAQKVSGAAAARWQREAVERGELD